MTNFAFESDMHRIRQAEATGNVDAISIARATVHAFAKHRRLDGRTGREFIPNRDHPEWTPAALRKLAAEFDEIIASYRTKRPTRRP